MKICGLGSGDLCHVSADGEERGIFGAWPQNFSEDKIEALMSFEAMASMAIESSTVVSIEKWTEEQVLADELKLHCLNDKDKLYFLHPAFQTVTALMLKNTIVFENMHLAVNYYGRMIKLAAAKVVPSLSNGDDLSQVLSQLEGIKLDFSNIICDDQNEAWKTSTPSKTNVRKCSKDEKRNYFLITEKTKLYFERNMVGGIDLGDDDDDEVKKAAQVLDGLGGLDDEIQLIREASNGVIGQKATRFA